MVNKLILAAVSAALIMLLADLAAASPFQQQERALDYLVEQLQQTQSK